MSHDPTTSPSTTSTNGHASTLVDADTASDVMARIRSKQARIGIVGLGYVGLPLAVEFADRGFETVGIDLDTSRVDRLNAGDNYIDDLDDAHVRQLVDADTLRATTAFDGAGDIDVFFICVPTPVTVNKDPDVSYIESASEAIAEHLRPGQVVILKSTTYPDTTEGVVLPILNEAAAQRGMTVGEDFFLAFSPERIDPGNQEFTTANTPVVVGGVTPTCTRVASLAIEQIVAQVHAVSNPKVAEMEKLLENIFRSVNIALVNELARLCDRIGDVSMWEVVEAAASKPFGFMPFYPGPGLGGHCIPVDPHYLSWLARKYDFETSFITLAARVNEGMPFYVADSVVEAIARQPIRLTDANVLILGVAFKRNVDDTRHSPAETVIKVLQEKGISNIRYHDPHVENYQIRYQDGRVEDIPPVDLTPDTLQQADAVVVITDHDAFDAHLIAEHAPLVVDTRNALDAVDDPALREKISVLGGGTSGA